MLRKIFILILACLFLSPLILFAENKAPAIIVIKSLDIEPYRLALEGFKQGLNSQGIKAKYIEYSLEGDGSIQKEKIAQAFRDNTGDLILTIGSGATTFAKENFKDRPIVFSMVLNPVASGFVSSLSGGSGGNITGAAMDVPLRRQFEVIKSSIPEIKRVVTFYNPKETQALVPLVQGAALSEGLSFKAIPVNSEKDMMDSLKQLVSKQDMLFAIADSKVYTPQNAQFIILETLRNGIPFVGISSAYVKAGALLSFSCNFKENGEQAAGLAARILNGESPSKLSVAIPERIEIAINENTARHIQIKLPERILKEAAEVF